MRFSKKVNSEKVSFYLFLYYKIIFFKFWKKLYLVLPICCPKWSLTCSRLIPHQQNVILKPRWAGNKNRYRCQGTFVFMVLLSKFAFWVNLHPPCGCQRGQSFLEGVNPKRHGGGADSIHCSGDRLPYLTGSYYGHKISWVYPKTSQVQGSWVIFLLSWQVFQKFSRDGAETMIFWDRKSQNRFFFNFFITKSPKFISNINNNFSQLSFEVYNICVAQKLWISEFLSKFFFAWTLATSATSRGRNFNLSNLNRVSNFS